MPPPPPPPPPGLPPQAAPSGPPKSTKTNEKGRSALLTDICKGARLKPATHLTVDKSKPILGNEGGPVSSSSTIGPAGGRGVRAAGPPALGNLFAGGLPRPKTMASHDSSVQNGYRATTALRAPRPGVTNSAVAPPPPPPSSASKPMPVTSNQESLTGHGANGRISGLGIGGFPQPPPLQYQAHRPFPPKLPGNRAPPPPPPARSLDCGRSLPPPPQLAPSNGKPLAPKIVPPPVPRPPGIAPPPPPSRNNAPPPPPPPARDQTVPSRPPAVTKPQAPAVPPPVKKNSIESRFSFRNDLPSAPGNFRKTPKTYPSALPKNNRSSGTGNRPCPPPPPV